MTEKFSIIIPLLNKGLYIERAILSILNQTIQNFEIIVIDGGSDDNGPNIVREFNDPRINFIYQSGKGVSNARNEAINLSKNEFIAFLDADDEWMPKHLETIIRLIKKYSHAGIFSTAYKIQNVDGKLCWANYQCIPDPPWEGLLPDYFKSGSFGDYPVCTSVAVIPKKIVDEMGGFPEGYWFGEDADLFGKIALKYVVAFSWEFGAIYHLDAKNRACDKMYPLDHEEPFVNSAREALKNGQVPETVTESLNEYIWRKEIWRAICNVNAGHSRTAQNILKQCNTKWHYNKKMKWLLLARLPYPLYLFIRDMQRKINKMM